MEEWRDVIGYEGRYKVSNLGKVRSLLKNAAGRLLSDSIVKGGYHRVQLYRDSTSKRNILTHLIVAAAFIGTCPSGHECNHKNGNKDDNSDQNLEYMTRKENILHSRDALGRKWPQGESHQGAKLTEVDVMRIRELRAQGQMQQQIAEQFSVHQTTISQICRGYHWRHV